MTGGSSPIGYLKAWHTDLYLSADADKVREALAEGEHVLLQTQIDMCHMCPLKLQLSTKTWKKMKQQLAWLRKGSEACIYVLNSS